MPDLTFSALAGDAGAERLLVVGPSLGTGVAALWRRCARHLPPSWRVIGWDIPGHGSGHPTDMGFTLEEVASVVRTQTLELTDGRPAAYAGVSLGGAVGFLLAAQPGPFEAVVTLAAAPKIGTGEAWSARASLVRSSGTAAVVEGSAQRWFAPGFIATQPDVASHLLEELTAVDDASYAFACEALARHDATALLGATQVPLLVVGGAEDPVVQLSSIHEVAGRAPLARSIVMDGVGHLPPAEAPEATAQLIANFWTKETL